MRRWPPFVFLVAAALSAGCGDAAPPADRGDPAESAGGAPGSAAEQPTPPVESGLRDPVPMSVEARVGGGRHLASGLGECQHTADASIYSVPAELWRASFAAGESGDPRRVDLTLWQPKAGGTMQMNLSVDIGGEEHSIATVQGGTISGKGSATARMDGPAGTLAVDGQEANGTAINVTIRCERLTVPVAEGG